MFEDWKKIASKIVVNYITVFLIYFFYIFVNVATMNKILNYDFSRYIDRITEFA